MLEQWTQQIVNIIIGIDFGLWFDKAKLGFAPITDAGAEHDTDWMAHLPELLPTFFALFSFEFVINPAQSTNVREVDPSFIYADDFLKSFPHQILQEQRTALETLLDLLVRKGVNSILFSQDSMQILVDYTIHS